MFFSIAFQDVSPSREINISFPKNKSVCPLNAAGMPVATGECNGNTQHAVNLPISAPKKLEKALIAYVDATLSLGLRFPQT
jgi:hypothetical protein